MKQHRSIRTARAAGLLTAAVAVAALLLSDRAPAQAPQAARQQAAGQPHDPGVVDGATNPELIPDTAAYRMLFRVISDASMEANPKALRAYIRQMGLGRQICDSCPRSVNRDGEEAEIGSLIALASQFRAQMASLIGRPQRRSGPEHQLQRWIASELRATDLSTKWWPSCRTELG